MLKVKRIAQLIVRLFVLLIGGVEFQRIHTVGSVFMVGVIMKLPC